MPCQGPSVNEEEVEKADSAVLHLLLTEFGLFQQPLDKLDPNFAVARQKVLADLKDTVREVLYQDACENW